MPYGHLILEELANVAGSLSELANPHHIKLLEASRMPYPPPELPLIDDLEVVANKQNDTESNPMMKSVKLVAMPPPVKSPSPPPIPELPNMHAWLGIPTDSDPNLLVCLSPLQRQYIADNRHNTHYNVEANPDLLLEMHKNFIERRGYHELSDEQLKAINNEKVSHIQHSTASGDDTAESKHNDEDNDYDEATTTTSTKDKNRLLAIIRDSKQLRFENSTIRTGSGGVCSDPTTATSTKETATAASVPSFKPVDSSESDKMYRLIESDGTKKQFSNIENFIFHDVMPDHSAGTKTPAAPIKPVISSENVDLNKTFSKFQNMHSNMTTDQTTESNIKPHLNERQSYESRNQFSNFENPNMTHELSAFKLFDESAKLSQNTFLSRDSKRFSDIERFMFGNETTPNQPPFNSIIPFNPIDPTDIIPLKSRLSEDFNKRFSNIENFVTQNTSANEALKKRYSQVESGTYETRKRIENGNVVFEFSNSKSENSKNVCDSNDCTTKSKVAPIQTATANTRVKDHLKNMKSETELDQKNIISSSSSSSSSAATTIVAAANNKNHSHNTNNNNDGTMQNDENPLANETKNNCERKAENIVNASSAGGVANEPKPLTTVMHHINTDEYFNENQFKFDEINFVPSFSENRFHSPWSMGNLSEIQHQDVDFTDNITKPIVKEENLCRGNRLNVHIRAPRLSTSSSNLSSISDRFEDAKRQYNLNAAQTYQNRQSMIDETPITQHVSQPYHPQRRKSLPKDIHERQLEYIRQKEHELNSEFDKLEQDRRNLLQEIEQMQVNQSFQDFVTAHKNDMMQRSSHQSIPSNFTSEADLFRQQMHDEWLDKIAEREERRLQKIIKITKSTDENAASSQLNNTMLSTHKSIDIGDEFLNRVKERRTKLKMASDSDWESGAESQPEPRKIDERSVDPEIKILEGENETDLRKLPEHIKQFASDFTKTTESFEEHCSQHYEHRGDECRATADGDGGSGIWSPSNTPQPVRRTFSNEPTSSASPKASTVQSPPTPPPPPPPPPFWAPRSAEASPLFERKEFRPVRFESPVLPRKQFTAEQSQQPPATPPWTCQLPDRLATSQSAPFKLGSHPNLPKATTSSPVTTSFQKAKEIHTNRSTVASSSSSYVNSSEQIQQNHSSVKIRPNEVVHPINIDYLSEPHYQQQKQNQQQSQDSENERPIKMTDHQTQRKVEGIGPTTREGMPIVLRSEVDEDLHHKWYKRMYNTLHKVHQDGRYPYKTNGYLSEPEPNYDSDYSIKYSTLDRRRIPSTGGYQQQQQHQQQQQQQQQQKQYIDDKYYGTMPNPIKCGSGIYKNQPGKIENYVPGHSSVSEKERKERLEHEKLANRSYTEGYLSKALKDQGYESDSTLVFRKKESSQFGQLSPDQKKQAYLNLQSGGEAPLQGFRKPAPEKPKETEVVPPPPPIKGVPLNSINNQDPESPRRYIESDVNIHYKTPVRFEYKDAVPDAELAYRQAEQMKKLYQEERRRKYLQELQDMSNRRHADYFTPSQKSPISLNRYDDFGGDNAGHSPNTARVVARALYNFQGQSARELSFKKGDIIYIRREIDKNWFEGEHNAMVGLLPSNYVEIITKDGSRITTKKSSEGQARAKFNFHAQSAIELSLNKGELVSLTRRVDDNWFEGRIANRKGIFPVSYVDVLTDIGSDVTPIISTKPIGAPAAHSLTLAPTHDYTTSSNTSRTNFTTDLSAGITTNGFPLNGSGVPGVVRESQTIQKTEVLHVDTNSEPMAYRAIYLYRPQNSDELELQEGDTVYVLEKCDDGWFVGTSQRTGCFGTFPGNYVEKI